MLTSILERSRSYSGSQKDGTYISYIQRLFIKTQPVFFPACAWSVRHTHQLDQLVPPPVQNAVCPGRYPVLLARIVRVGSRIKLVGRRKVNRALVEPVEYFARSALACQLEFVARMT